jgi:DNA-binding NtrC family response regulator
MTKILVVDDETDLEVLIKQKFRQKIRDRHYEFVFAINGNHALDQLEHHADVEVVLSDINMPEMDGLTLLSKLNETKPLLKAVIVSAYGDMENIRTAMNRGAFDFVTKPVNLRT